MLRVTPQAIAMFSRFSPKPDTSPAVTAAAKPRSITAKLSITTEGVCPYCDAQMRRSSAAGFQVWLCEYDRHVAPMKNQNVADPRL